MSWYNKEEFEYVFAKRTLKNLEFIEERYAKEKAEGKDDQDIEDVFEVTQLLNSFIGFIVIPRQEFYDYLPDNVSFEENSRAQMIMDSIKAEKRFVDSYLRSKTITRKGRQFIEYYDEKEQLTPKVLIHRLRNAISHNNICIEPIKCEQLRKIEGFKFTDSNKIYGTVKDGRFVKPFPGDKIETREQFFKITLKVDELRVLVVALCSLMLKQYGTLD